MRNALIVQRVKPKIIEVKGFKPPQSNRIRRPTQPDQIEEGSLLEPDFEKAMNNKQYF
jgi:hypothetical protein